MLCFLIPLRMRLNYLKLIIITFLKINLNRFEQLISSTFLDLDNNESKSDLDSYQNNHMK